MNLIGYNVWINEYKKQIAFPTPYFPFPLISLVECNELEIEKNSTTFCIFDIPQPLSIITNSNKSLFLSFSL